MVSSKKKVLSAFLSLAMIGSMVAAVPLTASADTTTTTATPVVTYSVHQQTYGWESTVTGPATAGYTGQSKRLEALKINAPSGATISYSVHQQSYGWEAAVSNGAQAGYTGKSKRLEAVKISLSGLPGYTIQYRVHQQTYGWENWVSNGTQAGYTGQSKRLEAIEIKLVPTVATVAAVKGTVAPGEQTAFAFADANGKAVTVDPTTVTWSLSDSTLGSISADGTFTAASKAGTETVTATVNGIALKATVKVYGAVAGYTVTAASTTVVANTVSTDVITVNAVDANGALVKNYSGKAAIAATAGVTIPATISGAANGNFDGTNLNFVNGVATVSVLAGAVPGLTSKITVTNADSPLIKDAVNNTITANVSVTTALQQATAIVVTPETKYIDASADGSASTNNAVVDVTVNDQTGNPMLGGTYVLTGSITGGTFADGTTSAEVISVSSANSYKALVKVFAVKGVFGSYVINVAGTGLTAGSATITATVPQAAKNLSLTLDSSSSSSIAQDGTTAVKYDIGSTDANGAPTTLPNHSYELYITDASGNAFTTVTGLGTAASDNGFAVAYTAGSISITPNAGKPYAGTYTAVLKDLNTTGALVASAPVTFTVKALSTYSKATVTSSTVVLTGATPTVTLTVQATDSNGNPVTTTASQTVTLQAAGNNTNGTTGTAEFGSSAASTTPYTTLTLDASGKATTAFSAQNYDGTTWAITGTGTPSLTVTGTSLYVESHPIASMTFAAYDSTVTPGNTTYLQAGHDVDFKLSLADANGGVISSLSANLPNIHDTFTLTVAHASGIKGLSTIAAGGFGTYNATTDTYTVTDSLGNIWNGIYGKIHGGIAGYVTTTLTDVSTNVTTSSAIQVVAGTTPATVDLGTLDNAAALSATKTSTFTVSLVDAGGNPVIAASDTYVKITNAADPDAFASLPTFETTGNIVTNVFKIAAGTSSVTVVLAPVAAGSGKITVQAYTDSACTSSLGASNTSGTITLS